MEDYLDIKPINFSNEKHFIDEIENIMSITKDTQLEWNKREEALKRIGGIILGNYGQSMNFLKILNNKLYLNISIQMMNLRSTLLKEACRIVILAAKTYRNQFDQGVEKLISSIVLYKLIASANKVISECGSKCVSEIIKYVESERIIIKIIEQINSKNITVRLKSTQFLLYILNNYKKQFLLKQQINIEQFIINTTHDPSLEVRSIARQLFIQYSELYTERFSELFEKFDTGVKKAITDENKKYECYRTNSCIITKPNEELNNFIIKHEENRTKTNSINKLETSNYSIKNMNDLNYNSNIIISPSTTKNSIKFKISENCPKSDKKNITTKSLYLNPSPVKSKLNKYTKSMNEPKACDLRKSIPAAQQLFGKDEFNSNNKKDVFKNIEQILLLNINKCFENDLTQKIGSLEAIQHLFNEIYTNANTISSSTFKKLISLLLDNLTDNYSKIYDQVCSILTKLLYYLNEVFEVEEINKLVKLVVINISHSETEISNKANQLMEIMRKKLDLNFIVKSLLEMIHLDTSDDIIIILLEIILLSFDQIEESLSDENYLLSFILIFIKFSLEKEENKEILYKLFDILEKVFIRYKNALILAINSVKDDSMKKKVLKLFDIYKKNIAEFIHKNSNSYRLLNITNIYKNNNNLTKTIDSEISLLNDLNFNYNDKNLVNDSSLKLDKNCKQFKLFPENYEDLLTKQINTEFLFLSNSYDSSTFMKFLTAEESNFVSFLFSLSRIKKEEITSVMNHLFHALTNHPNLLMEDMDLLINRILFIAEKFNYNQDRVSQIFQLIVEKLQSETFVQLVSRYFPKYETNFLELLLNTFSFAVNKIDTENLLFLIPSFIDSLFSLLNNHVAEIRKQVVYCIVDLYFQIGEDFETYINQLTIPQRNLINIYIKKREKK